MALNDISDARVDVSDVRGGGFEAEMTDDEVKEHIATAHTVVEDELTGLGMSDGRLARIEMYLARHFIRVEPDRQVDTETAGPMNRSYSGDYDRTFYESTAPGQTALRLDESDTLGRSSVGQFFTVG